MKEFFCHWEIENQVPVVYLKGDITADANRLLSKTYRDIRLKNKSATIIFDFSNSDYINSSGISILINLLHLHKEHNGDFVFIGLTEHFQKVMEIIGLNDFITMYDSKKQAFSNI